MSEEPDWDQIMVAYRIGMNVLECARRIDAGEVRTMQFPLLTGRSPVKMDPFGSAFRPSMTVSLSYGISADYPEIPKP